MRIIAFLFTLFTFVAVTSPAQAYFGPGAAIGLVGYFFGFAFTIGFALLILAYYPIRFLLKKRKAKVAVQNANAAENSHVE